VLLSLRYQRSVIDDGAVGYDVCAVVYGNRRGDEVAIGVVMASANFRKLARSPADGILVTIRAGSGIEYWA
jgi:hypothetical protein